jgi:hypothetical protein
MAEYILLTAAVLIIALAAINGFFTAIAGASNAWPNASTESDDHPTPSPTSRRPRWHRHG